MNANTYAFSIKSGLLNGTHDQVLEQDLIYDMERIALNNRIASKHADYRVDKTIFMKAATEHSLELSTKITLDLGIAARRDMDQRSRAHMMILYNDILKMLRAKSLEIVNLRLEENRIKKTIEQETKAIYEKLFTSIGAGNEDKLFPPSVLTCLLNKPLVRAHQPDKMIIQQADNKPKTENPPDDACTEKPSTDKTKSQLSVPSKQPSEKMQNNSTVRPVQPTPRLKPTEPMMLPFEFVSVGLFDIYREFSS